MYNENDEMYEVEDFDEDIKRRQELIEEAKSIPTDAKWNDVFRQISDLKKKWKRIQYWESDYEDQLAEEFDSYIDVFYQKRREGYESNKAIKQELIDRANEILKSDNLNQATEEMNELMAQWKASGSAGKETDDALWEAFNAARQKFFDKKHDYWENLQSKFDNAKQVKKELIEEAKTLVDSEDFAKTSAKFRELMDKWKAVGSAGKQHENKLWDEFNEVRQKFYDRRNAYYEELHGKQDENYNAKKALSDQAKEIADKKEYTRENTAAMKKLGADWKTIGNCGKDKEDEIWKEFRSIMDAYFEGLKEWNEQKHQQWRQKMIDARNRKQDMIQNQRRQIKRLQNDIVGLIGERAIKETEEEIAEKEEFIKELEADLEDIEKTLAEDK